MTSDEYQRVKQVFNAAREVPQGPERERYVEQACGEDAAIRAEVLSLLSMEEGSFLASLSAAGGGEPAVTADFIPEKPSGLPTVPGYQLQREVGRGGQAVVFLALSVRTGRRVAVKLMRQGPLADQASRKRFERESQILAALEHPNIVTVLDRGSAADGSEYFVMDYVEGNTLDEQLWGAGPPQEGVTPAASENPAAHLLLFLKICDAVNAAHLRGIIHRDIKPSNIRIDERGEPHVLDFGLARAAAIRTEDGEGGGPITLTGQFLGSLPWASPEQASGMASKIDTRTDVYSLGVILYQMLTGGRFPYEVAGSMRDVLNNIITARPPPPSEVLAARAARDGRQRARRRGGKVEELNHVLDVVVLRALAKRRNDRYQSAGELARDVENYLAGRPTAAQVGDGRIGSWRPSRRALLAGAASLGVLAIGAGGTGYLVLRERREPNRDNAGRATAPATSPASAEDGPMTEVDALRRLRDWGADITFDAAGVRVILPKPAPDPELSPVLRSISRLDRLWFAPRGVTDATLEWVSGLKKLRELGTTRSPITDAGLLYLATLTRMEVLDLTDTSITGRGLAALASMPELRELFVNDTGIDAEGFTHLPTLPLLRAFWAAHTGVSDEVLERLATCQLLSSLTVQDSRVSDAGLAALSGKVQLETLNVGNCPRITDAGARTISEWRKLGRLAIGGTFITETGLQSISTLPVLSFLNADGINISDESLGALIGKMTNMAELGLVATQVGDAAMLHFASLHRLQVLGVSKTRVGDEGMTHLATLPNLYALFISETRVTDGGLASIAKMPKLQMLTASYNRITDTGLRTLGTSTTIETLVLAETSVTDTGLDHLRRMSRLQTLDVARTGVTEAGVRRFLNAVGRPIHVVR